MTIAILKQMIMKEWKQMIAVLAGILIVAFIAFFRESPVNILRATLGFYWLFVLPAWLLTGYWYHKLSFTQRILLGGVLSAALTGIASYYLGLWVMGISKQTVHLPLALIAVGGFFSTRAQASTAAEHPKQQE